MKHSGVLKRHQIDSAALDVTDALQEAGYQGLLVGGCVRDLLVGQNPKDFDVATDATPEEVRDLFRRARLIGRRFRIVHVRVGREVFEVSTFRRSAPADDAPADESDEQVDRVHDAAGILLRDNVFGTLEEDAFRRDFTVNALYFDPSTEEVIDFVDGLQDLEDRTLRLIGVPKVRLTEDPVRLLRAIRFQAKLHFELERTIAREIPDVADLLVEMPAARLFDEVSKMFLSGYGQAAWHLLCEYELNYTLFPCTPADDELIDLAMRNTDTRLADGKGVTPGFLFAVLLWRDYQALMQQALAQHKPFEAAAIAADQTFRNQQPITSIPKRISQFAKDTWALQDRMVARAPRMIARLMSQQRFRSAYDFLVLRASAGEPELQEAADWWTNYQEQNPDIQEKMRSALAPAQTGTPKKRRRRRRKPAGAGSSNAE